MLVLTVSSSCSGRACQGWLWSAHVPASRLDLWDSGASFEQGTGKTWEVSHQQRTSQDPPLWAGCRVQQDPRRLRQALREDLRQRVGPVFQEKGWVGHCVSAERTGHRVKVRVRKGCEPQTGTHPKTTQGVACHCSLTAAPSHAETYGAEVNVDVDGSTQWSPALGRSPLVENQSKV